MTATLNGQPIQLSLKVDPHPSLKHITDGGVLTSTLKLALDLHLPQDLQPADALHVVVSDADGTVLGHVEAQVESVTFKPIKDDGAVIGTERAHKAKQE